MSLESLTIALAIASFVLAIASAVLAIYSATWQWRVYRDAQSTQNQANALLARVSEKVDLVATHTSRQVDRAFDVIAAQAAGAREVAADYDSAPRGDNHVSPTDITAESLEVVLLDAVYWELESLCQDYLEGVRGCDKPVLGEAVEAFARYIQVGNEDSGLAKDLRALRERFTQAKTGTLSGELLTVALKDALWLAAFLRPRLSVPPRPPSNTEEAAP